MLGQVEASEKSDSARKTGSKFAAAFSIRSMSMAALSLLVAVGLATAAAGGTYAYLNDKASLTGGTVTAGTAALTLSTPAPLAMTNLSPGQRVYSTVTVTNTGAAPLNLRVASLSETGTPSPLTNFIVVGLSLSSSTIDCSATAPAPTWTRTFATPVAPDLGYTLPANATATLCLSAALPLSTGAGQGQTTTFNLQLDGTQA